MKYNEHRIIPGRESQSYDLFDPGYENMQEMLSMASGAGSGAPGIWSKTAMFNHSCLPNAVYTYIGDLMIVQAITEIEAGDEIL